MGATTPRTTSRLLPLVVLCTGQLMIILDQNIVNVALPAIQRDLGFSAADLVWTVNAYVVPFGGLLLLAGRLGDLLGRKRMFIAGLALFTLASLLCGLATDQGTLIAARFVQGIGGAVASAGILGMIVTMFPEPREQARAIGAFSCASAGGGAIGPLVGGVLTDAVSWNWIFFINLPLGAAVVAVALRALRHEPGAGLRGNADVAGAVLVTAGLMLAVQTIVGAETAGWGSARTLGGAAAALALLAAFLVRESRAKAPLLPLRVLAVRSVAVSNTAQLLLIAAMFGFLYFGTLYLQKVLGYDALQTGLAFLPAALSIAVVSLALAARLITRLGARPVLLGGLVMVTAGFVLFARIPLDGGYASAFLPSALLLGLGFGAAMPALMMLGVADAGPEDSGVASGLFNTSQQIGGAVGLAALNTLATSRTGASAERAALLDGYRLAFATAAGLVLAAAAVAWAALRPGRDRGDAEENGTPVVHAGL